MTNTVRVQLTGTTTVFEVSSSGSRDSIDVGIPNLDILRLAPCVGRVYGYRACIEETPRPPVSPESMVIRYRLAALPRADTVEELSLIRYQEHQAGCAACACSHIVYYPVSTDELGGFIRWTLALTELTESRIL